MDSQYRRELVTATTAVQRAAHLSRLVLAASNNRVGHISKNDLSPVTLADFAIQALLTATLHAAFPGDTFVGEETADDLRENPALLASVWDILKEVESSAQNTDSSAQVVTPSSPDHVCELVDRAGLGIPGTGRVWVFDPIDGTQAFLRGQVFAINVCLLVDGKQTLSVVGLPSLAYDVTYPVADDTVDPDPNGGTILYAVRGQGSFRRRLAGPADLAGERLAKQDDNPSTLRLVTSTESSSSPPGLHEKMAAKLGMEFPGNNLLGWVPRWAALALGHANITFWVYYKRDRLAKIWDHAGAMLLFEETGGKVTDADGKAPNLTADRTMVANYGWVAAPAGIHSRILETVRETMREEGKGDLLR